MDSDETNVQVMIYSVPQAEVWALSEVLADAELSVDWDGRAAKRGTVHVGTVYTDRNTYGDRSRDVADEIIAAAPGATFTAWTDQCAEYLGALVRYTPDLGRHDADCDADGHALHTTAQVMRTAMGSALPVEALAAYTGAAWTAALSGRPAAHTLTAVEPCDCGPVPGALVGMNDRDEIQRCDNCARFESDDAAAEAVAAAVGGRVDVMGNDDPVSIVVSIVVSAGVTAGGQVDEQVDVLSDNDRHLIVVQAGSAMTADEIRAALARQEG